MVSIPFMRALTLQGWCSVLPLTKKIMLPAHFFPVIATAVAANYKNLEILELHSLSLATTWRAFDSRPAPAP